MVELPKNVNKSRMVIFESFRLDGGDGGSSEWRGGPQLQEPRAKFCAVSTEDSKLAVVGGETDEQAATAGKDFRPVYRATRLSCQIHSVQGRCNTNAGPDGVSVTDRPILPPPL